MIVLWTYGADLYCRCFTNDPNYTCPVPRPLLFLPPVNCTTCGNAFALEDVLFHGTSSPSWLHRAIRHQSSVRPDRPTTLNVTCIPD